MTILTNYPIAIPYKYNNDKYNEIAKEFNILFIKSRNRLEDLLVFVKEYKDTRINITFTQGVDIPVLTSARAVNENVYVQIQASDMMIIPKLQENNIPFFFNMENSVTNYTNLDCFIHMGVSDIYIADDLCYNLKQVSEYCHAHNVNIRMSLNHIPSTALDRGVNPRSPFFRPQDIDELSNYIDVFEFDCGEDFSWGKFNVLYRNWFQKKNWHGQLKDINDDVYFDFSNESLYPDLSSFKMQCERRCNKRASSPCRKCEQWVSVADTLTEKGLRFQENTGQK